MTLLQGIWKLNMNGQEGELNITMINEGSISGTILTLPFEGSWNEAASTITFYANDINIRGLATFVGYLFSTPQYPGTGTDTLWTICGYFLVPSFRGFLGARSSSRKATFGWFAQKTEII